jgi:hypothetical protein
VGCGLGLIAACTAAAAKDTNEIIAIGIEAIVISFNLALLMGRRPPLIDSSTNCWYCVTVKMSEDEATTLLQEPSKLLPISRHAYLGVIGDNWVTIFGPKMTLE